MFQLTINKRSSGVFLLPCLLFALSAHAENTYTNHAGNVVSGWPVALTQTQVVLAENAATNQPPATATNAPARTTTYPLSIFPESERRRIAADFALLQGDGQLEPLRIPAAVKRAVAGAEKAMARSRKRAELGLCTQEESDAFCAKSEAALQNYLDKQVESGVITPAERTALGR